MRLLGDLENRVVVAALDAAIIDNHPRTAHRYAGQRDILHISIEPIFERANSAFEPTVLVIGVMRALRSRCDIERGGGIEEIIKRQSAAAVQIEDARLEALGAIVFEIFLDG